MLGDETNILDFEGCLLAGRYQLEHCLDEGNFGAVYRARHLAYGVELRPVAVKVAKRAMSDHEARRMFGDALLMASLSDATPDAVLRQHFVTVYDAGRDEAGPLAGRPFLVMELVQGGSLKSCLKAGPFPLKRALDYFDQILTALAFMHGSHGHSPIVHRDLKPANILVSRPQNAPDVLKISDFGLAVEVGELLGWVASGGDLAYLAPESFSHEICSPQSDVYMLGLIFYEMLAGEHPFKEVGQHLRGANRGDHDELRRAHLAARRDERFPVVDPDDRDPDDRQRFHVELRHPGPLVPDPAALVKVLRDALAVDMNSRPFNNAIEFRHAWRQALESRGDGPPPPPAPPWETVRRLTGEAEACFRVKDFPAGERLLAQARNLNENRQVIPDRLLVGKTYLLAVQRLLDRRDVPAAQQLAQDGYRRRKCHFTCLALALALQADNPVLAETFRKEADTHPRD
jgi:serine/threonine protein kinase